MRSNLPNALSAARIPLAVVIVATSEQLTASRYVLLTSIVILAMVTDALDGYFARRWHSTSELGYVLDAMGDRAIHLRPLSIPPALAQRHASCVRRMAPVSYSARSCAPPS